MQKLLRQFILASLLEAKDNSEEEAHIPDREDDLLVEPDFSADEADAKEKFEQSTVGGTGGAGPAIAGYTLPLGMKPPGQKRQPAYKVAGKAYGNAKLAKKK